MKVVVTQIKSMRKSIEWEDEKSMEAVLNLRVKQLSGVVAPLDEQIKRG